MNLRANALAIAMGATFATFGAGCNKSPEGGVNGTNDTFKVSAPIVPTMMKQGETKSITVSLDRGSAFQQTVKLVAETPKGLKAEVNQTTLKPADLKDVSVTITVDKDAALGDHTVKITATPEKGNATSVDIVVKVSEGPK